MFNSTQEVLLFVLGQIVVAAAIWGGIRADLKAMHARLELVQKATEAAHSRLDRYLESVLYNGKERP